MLALTHTVTGAAVGSFIESWPLAFFVGIFLHFLADKTVHYFPKKISNKEKTALVDWIISAVFIYWLSYNGLPISVVAGALGGLLVDVVLLPVKSIRESKIGKWHIERQTHTRNFVYILKDVGVIVLCLLIIWRMK